MVTEFQDHLVTVISLWALTQRKPENSIREGGEVDKI
jgi:hypothetical protein